MALTPWANQLRKRKDFFGPVIVWYHCCGSVGKHSSAERASKRQSCLPPVSPEAERPWERKRPARPYYKLNCYVFVWVCLVGWWWWTPLIPASRKQRLTWSTEWVPGQPGLHTETLSWKTIKLKKKIKMNFYHYCLGEWIQANHAKVALYLSMGSI